MNIFKRNDPLTETMADELDAAVSRFADQIQKPITDYAADAATAMLEYADAEISECDERLAEYEDRRRRAVLVREAYAPTLAKLETGFDPIPGVSGPRSSKKHPKPVLALQAAE